MLKWMQSQYRVSQWIFNFKVQNCILSGVQSVCSGNFATVHLALYFIFNYHIHTLEKITNVFWACNVVRLSKVICFSRCSRLTPKKENKQHASAMSLSLFQPYYSLASHFLFQWHFLWAHLSLYWFSTFFFWLRCLNFNLLWLQYAFLGLVLHTPTLFLFIHFTTYHFLSWHTHICWIFIISKKG